MRFQRISTLSQQYRSDSIWQTLNSSVSVSSMNAVKLQTSNEPYYLNYRTRNRGKDWLDFVKSTSSADFAGWKGYAVTGLEVQMFNSAGTRIFEEYIVMYRSKVAGEWLSWVSNASLDMMEELQNEQNLGGTLDASSIYSGWESKGDIQALDIRVYKDNGAPGGEITPPDIDFYQQYRTNSTWLSLTQSVLVTNMNGIKIQTRNKPFYIKYRTRNRGKGWLDYVLSTNNVDYAGWKGYAVTGLDLQVFSNNGTRLFDTHAVMYRSKVAGEWLSWVSNVSLEQMEKLQRENNLGGTLDGNSVYSGWETKGDIQAIDVRLFENIGSVGGETPPISTADFSQQYRASSTWLELTPSVLVTNMNSIKLQTKNKPYYLKYRTSNRGKGWLDYVLSNSTADFAGWKGFPVTGLEIQMFRNDGTRIYDQHAVMYRSKVAGDWLSWVSNVDLELMTKIAREYSLSGALDANSTYSGWESKGDIQAIEIRVFDNVGTSTEVVPTPPSVDIEIPTAPNNPNGFRIFIDAGHGGNDPGACNGSYYEKNYTLKLSLLQKKYFEQAGYQVTMSREEDITMENSSKANFANKINADLYIANHINAFAKNDANGVEVYHQANPSYSSSSKAIAQQALANLSTIFNSRGIKTKTQDDGRDWFCVLRETKMPSILIEHGFLSNASDLVKLNDEANLDAMAKAVVRAICDTMPNPEDRNYDKAKLLWGKQILSTMDVIPLDLNKTLVLNEEYELIVAPNFKVTYEISSSTSFGPGDASHTFDIRNGKYSLDFSNQIENFCNNIETDANPIFSGETPPLEPNFPKEVYEGLSIGSELSFGLEYSLNSAALLIRNGSFSFSIDPIALLIGRLEIATAFNMELSNDPLDINSTFSVKITYKFQNFILPSPQLELAYTPESLLMLASLGIIALAAGALVSASIPVISAAGPAIISTINTFTQYFNSLFQRLFPELQPLIM